MNDYSDLKLMAEHATGFTDMSLAPDVVLALISDHDELADLRARLAELVSAVRSINFGPHHAISRGEDNEPWYPQRKEWVEWILELCDAAQRSEVDPQCSEVLRTQGGQSASAETGTPTEHADSCSWANGKSEICDFGYQSARVERKRHIPRTDAVYDASWGSEKLPVPKCMDAIRPVDPGKEIVAMVESALRRSFSLGQLYWQQADSDSTCQQNKSDQTMEVQAQHILSVVKSIKELTQ